MNRNQFLRMSASAVGMLAVNKVFGESLLADQMPVNQSFGIQLWSVRDDMVKDPKGTLRKLAAYGYKEIESFKSDTHDLFFGMKPKAAKRFLTSLGMTMNSAHYLEPDLEKFEETAKAASEVGVKILYYPWEGSDKTIEEYKTIATELNERGKICKKYGMKYGFHNHDYSFKKVDGVYPQDILMQNTNKANVVYEMDIYWVVTAGEDPIKWLKKYPNRFVSAHVKDRNKTAPDGENNASCVLGKGKIDFPKVLKTAKLLGMKYFNVEQEKWDEGTPLECAKMDAAYMKKLKI